MHLLSILEAIEKIEIYTKGFNQRSFLKDSKTIDAVTRNIEIIGEASKFISKSLRNSTDLPWKRIIGMRNVVVHEYFGVDAKIVWKIVKDQLGDLKKMLVTKLKDLDKV